MRRALDRYCRATLIDAAEICAQPLPSESTGQVVAPDRYQELFWLVSERNRRIAEVFDGHSRSRALMQLMQIVRLNLLTTDELAVFSDETQELIARARELAAEDDIVRARAGRASTSSSARRLRSRRGPIGPR